MSKIFDTSYIDRIKSFITHQAESILDIGFGTGRNVYYSIHNLNSSDIYGCDIDTKDKIEKCESFYTDFSIEKGFHIFSEKLKDEFNSSGMIDYYNHYSEFAVKYLNKTPLPQKYLDSLLANLEYGIGYEDYLTKVENMKFDLIFLSRIIHYESVKHDELLSKCKSVLNESGLIYISFPRDSGRQKINTFELTEFIQGIDLSIEKDENEDSIFIYCTRP